MRTKHVLNRRIVRVVQSNVQTNSGVHTCVDYLELDNGVRLIPYAMETESDPIGDMTLNTVGLKPRAAKSVLKRNATGALPLSKTSLSTEVEQSSTE